MEINIILCVCVWSRICVYIFSNMGSREGLKQLEAVKILEPPEQSVRLRQNKTREKEHEIVPKILHGF